MTNQIEIIKGCLAQPEVETMAKFFELKGQELNVDVKTKGTNKRDRQLVVILKFIRNCKKIDGGRKVKGIKDAQWYKDWHIQFMHKIYNKMKNDSNYGI